MVLMLSPGLIAQQSNSAGEHAGQALALQNQMPEQESEAYAHLQQIIDLDVQNVTLEDALTAIADEANLKLMYRKALLPEDKKVSYHNRSMTVYEALWNVLEGTGIQFAISQNRQLVLFKMQDVEEVEQEVQGTITGRVIDSQTGESLPGVNILIQGTSTGTSTDAEGYFQMEVPSLDETLILTFIGYDRAEVEIDGRAELEIELTSAIIAGDELVVVGYGVQRRSDLTGSVSSVPQERLEMVPNLNISQAIQGSVPGVTVQTTSAGAAPSEAILVRGRNSITADNSPLIVVDGIPFGGNISDINPNDLESIEILKDASAAAIYGSRGSNGVILITTKSGREGITQISYDAKYSIQNYTMFPEVLNGEQFYHFKQEREPGSITPSEQAIYESGEWTDWPALGLRRGQSHQHNLSVSGGVGDTRYFLSGNFLNVRGLALNDDFSRLIGRINVDTKISNWLTIGTRSSLSYRDESGMAVSITGAHGSVFRFPPLSTPFNEDGTPTQFPWPEETSHGNPLAPLLVENSNESYQINSNNYLIIDFPFIEGLSNRINAGIGRTFDDFKDYRPSTTVFGAGQHQGITRLQNDQYNSTTFENILSYTNDFALHNIFFTGVLSFERNTFTRERTDAEVFPNDVLGWNAIGQAGVITPSTGFEETTLISQMMRLNYGYDSRYLLTLTFRRDGFSGFGRDNRWGFFPSASLAWNFASENFFPWPGVFNELKPRISYGLNGNQAVSPYQTMARVSEENMVSLKQSQAGFIPNTLANETLGWESSRVLNAGIDFGIFDDRFSGYVEVYQTNTSDLLLARTISSVHGITSITQNIGETKNQGLDFNLRSRNIVTPEFQWSTSGNISFNRNEIVDLYGDGRDDVANAWFIGQPIRIHYDYLFDGVWQLDEAEEATSWGSQPGFVKLRDITGDGQLTGDDRQIIGSLDPNFLWGLTNSFVYKNFNLEIFIHGVHGVTRENNLLQDAVATDVRRNTTLKNWWTPDNPTNDFWMNHVDAHQMDGINATIYEDASFVRIKDVSFSYTFPLHHIESIGFSRLRLYVTGRNLHTFTRWEGLDPELTSQYQIPLQREFVFGLDLGF